MNAANNVWAEKKVDRMLKQLKASGFFAEGIAEAKHLQSTYGYVWDVALKISCDYWCR
jgi:hypothetical protein